MRSKYLSPFTASLEAYDSSSAISSGVSFKDRAPMFWLKFSILVVPGMGHTSFPWWWTQARASCDEVQPFLAAMLLTFSNMVLLCSRFSGRNLGRDCKQWLKILASRPNLVNKRIVSWRHGPYSFIKPMIIIHNKILTSIKNYINKKYFEEESNDEYSV